MRAIRLSDRLHVPEIDVCRYCQLFWFDPGEFEVVPKTGDAIRRAPVPEPVVEHSDEVQLHQVGASWQYPFMVLGVPVEIETSAVERWPWVTWGTFIVALVLFLFSFGDSYRLLRQFAFLPSDPWREWGTTWILSFFLHGGIDHIAINLYFLLLIGDNAEDLLGSLRFGALLLLAHVGGILTHWAIEPRLDVPLIGASGGISGALAYYALRLPRARLLFAHPFYGLAALQAARWLPPPILRAWFAFLVWAAIQTVGLVFQLSGTVSVSFAAHLGGALAGVAAHFLGLQFGDRSREVKG